MSDFPCTSCGACCRSVSTVENFPFGITKDGACEHLRHDNSCAIYDTRPDICRVDIIPPGYTKQEWYKVNALACNHLQARFFILGKEVAL